MAVGVRYQTSLAGYVLFDGSDRLLPGDAVRLSEAGRSLHSGSDPERVGKVIRQARDGRHVWVRWHGRTSPHLCLDAHLRRVPLRSRRAPRGSQKTVVAPGPEPGTSHS